MLKHRLRHTRSFHLYSYNQNVVFIWVAAISFNHFEASQVRRDSTISKLKTLYIYNKKGGGVNFSHQTHAVGLGFVEKKF
jgi:hypothetical protein